NGSTLATAEIFNPATGTFTPTTGSMTLARTQHVSFLLADGRVLVAGVTSDVFDPVTGTFTAVMGASGLPTGVGTRIVPLSGGRTFVTRTSSMSGVFDPVTMRFIAGPTLAATGIGGSASLGADGDLLVFPGAQGGTTSTTSGAVWRVKDFPGKTA